LLKSQVGFEIGYKISVKEMGLKTNAIGLATAKDMGLAHAKDIKLKFGMW